MGGAGAGGGPVRVYVEAQRMIFRNGGACVILLAEAFPVCVGGDE